MRKDKLACTHLVKFMYRVGRGGVGKVAAASHNALFQKVVVLFIRGKAGKVVIGFQHYDLASGHVGKDFVVGAPKVGGDGYFGIVILECIAETKFAVVGDIEKVHVDVADFEFIVECFDLFGVDVGEQTCDALVKIGRCVVVSFKEMFKAKDMVGVFVGDNNPVYFIWVDVDRCHTFQ